MNQCDNVDWTIQKYSILSLCSVIHFKVSLKNKNNNEYIEHKIFIQRYCYGSRSFYWSKSYSHFCLTFFSISFSDMYASRINMHTCPCNLHMKNKKSAGIVDENAEEWRKIALNSIYALPWWCSHALWSYHSDCKNVRV